MVLLDLCQTCDVRSSISELSRLRGAASHATKVSVRFLAIAASPLRAASIKSVVIRSTTDQPRRLFSSRQQILSRTRKVRFSKTVTQLCFGGEAAIATVL
jgi:hypothetical protein